MKFSFLPWLMISFVCGTLLEASLSESLSSVNFVHLKFNHNWLPVQLMETDSPRQQIYDCFPSVSFDWCSLLFFSPSCPFFLCLYTHCFSCHTRVYGEPNAIRNKFFIEFQAKTFGLWFKTDYYNRKEAFHLHAKILYTHTQTHTPTF